jgi:hypothetical protein
MMVDQQSPTARRRSRTRLVVRVVLSLVLGGGHRLLHGQCDRAGASGHQNTYSLRQANGVMVS